MFLNGAAWVIKKVSLGRIEPSNYELSEEWVIPEGGIIPIWILKLLGRDTATSVEEYTLEGDEGGTRSYELRNEVASRRSSLSEKDDVPAHAV